MSEKILRKKVEQTILMPDDLKIKILNAEWNQNLMNNIKIFFDKYGRYEEEFGQYLLSSWHTMIVDYIREIEKSEDPYLQARLKELEKYIAYFRTDI